MRHTDQDYSRAALIISFFNEGEVGGLGGQVEQPHKNKSDYPETVCFSFKLSIAPILSFVE